MCGLRGLPCVAYKGSDEGALETQLGSRKTFCANFKDPWLFHLLWGEIFSPIHFSDAY